MKKILLVIGLSFVLSAILLTILLSMFSYYRYPQILPSEWTLHYWLNFFSINALMMEAILNSLKIGVFTAILSTIVGFMTGRAVVSHFKSKRNVMMIVYTLPLFVPATALFIGVHMMMIKFSLNNNFWGIVISHAIIAIPYSTNIAVSFYEGISIDMENIAKTLGCGPILLFKKILLPLLMPGILLSSAICFLLSFSEYFAAFLVGGGKLVTLSTLYYPYINNGDYGNSAVLSIVFVAINLSVFAIAEYGTRKLSRISNYLFE
ncbi:MAG: ABC transporter permease subunit [Bacillota bacterium]|nr:ABC transporter permease subunit [Bacillota bacterium]